MDLLKNKYVRQLFTFLVVGVVGYLFYTVLSENWEQVRQVSFEFNSLSVAAIVLFALAVPVSGWLWGTILNALTKNVKKVDTIEAVRVHIASWLLKYIPGGPVVNKVMWAAKYGYGKKLAVISYGYESAFLLAASIVPTVPVLLLFLGGDEFANNSMYLLLPILVIVPLLLVAHKKTFSFIINVLLKKIAGQSADKSLFLSNYESLKLQMLFLLPRLINGVGFVLVAVSFLDIGAEVYVPLAAAYVLAHAIGLLAVFVPNGIGVREAVIVIFAVNYMPIEQAIILSIVTRLYSTIADGVLALIYGVMNLHKRKK